MTAESVVKSNQSLAAEADFVESNNIQKQQSGEVTTSGDELVPKVRKPYTITKQRERWTEEEHQKFLEALKLYGRAWRRIEEHIGTKTAVQIRSHAQKFFSKLEREQAGGISSGKAQDIGIPPPRPKRKPSHPYPRKAGVPAVENVPSQTVLPSTPALLVSPTLCEGKMKPAAFAPYVSSRPRNVQLGMATMGTSPGGSQAELKLFGQTVVVPTVTRAVPPVVVKGIDKLDPLLKGPPSFQHNVEAEQAINTRIVSACSSGITMLESENGAADVRGCATNSELKRAAYHENLVPPPILQFGNELRKLFATAPLNMPMTDQHPAMDLAALYYSRFLEGLQSANAIPPLNFCNLGLDGAWQPGSPNASIYAAAMAALWPNLSAASFSDMTSSVLRSMLTGISSDTFRAENSIDALAAASAWWTLQGFIRRGFLAQHIGPFLETAASLGMNSPLTMKRQDNTLQDHKRQDGQEGENMTMNDCATVEAPHIDDSPLAHLKDCNHQTSKRTLTGNFEGLDGGKRRVRSRSISGCNDPCENDQNGPDSRPPSSSGSGDFSGSCEPRNGDGDASGNSGPSSNSSRCGAAQGTAIPTDGSSFDRDRTAEATTEQELNAVKIPSLQHASSSNRARPQHLRGQKAARPSRSGGSDGEQRREVSQEGRMAFQALFAHEKLPQTFSRGRPREFTHEDDCATRAPHPNDEPVTSDLESVCQFQIPLVSGRSSSFSIPVKGSLDEYTEQISGVESMASGTGPITGESSNSRDCGDGLAKVGSDASAFSVSSSSSSRSGFVPYCRAQVRVNPTSSKEFKPSCAMEADNQFRDGLRCLEEEVKLS